MRHVDLIVVHCTATPAGRHVTVEEVDAWHRQRGWSGIGYHWLVGLDGQVWEGRDEDQMGAHVRNWNRHSIGVCYVGGGNKPPYTDTRTEAQKRAMWDLIDDICGRYPIRKIVGHRDLDPRKACPCFDARAEYWSILHPAPAVSATAEEVEDDNMLSEGSFGPDVREWQQSLKDFGYTWIMVDGDFGPETRKLTYAFQVARGIVADGIVGPQSESTMEAVLQLLDTMD